jgi:glycosyltransferase involved in cell wall biosynthesis
MRYSQLSIVTITFNDNVGLERTIESLKGLIAEDARLIVIDGRSDNHPASLMLPANSIYIGERDNGIYEALNKGLALVSTEYFIFLHSGDVLIESGFRESYNIHRKSRNDITLNSVQIINQYTFQVERTHSAYLWRPWMLNFHVQPPHLGIIYSTSFIGNFKFDEKMKIVSDFFFIKNMFKHNPKYEITRIFIVNMVAGGKTTNGAVSFFKVSRELARVEGVLKMFFCLFFRVILKNLHRVN